MFLEQCCLLSLFDDADFAGADSIQEPKKYQGKITMDSKKNIWGKSPAVVHDYSNEPPVFIDNDEIFSIPEKITQRILIDTIELDANENPATEK
ncbi:hypothetical protein ACXX82_04120 [Glaciimonas sp. GNP009]